jgi:hypothetical protein
VKSEDSAEELITELEKLLADTVSNSWPKEIDFSIKMFSDCICTSAPPNYIGFIPTIATLMSAQSALMRRKILVRGAITTGKHYESPKLIFSDALVRAYRLEQSVALYPRIVVDPALIPSIYGAALADEKTLRVLSNPFLLRDSDGQIFVNYLSLVDDPKINANRESTLKIQRELILQGRQQFAANPSIMVKLAWLERYHNFIVQRMHPVRPDLFVGSHKTHGFEMVTPES